MGNPVVHFEVTGEDPDKLTLGLLERGHLIGVAGPA
jgi:hypothetical protein